MKNIQAAVLAIAEQQPKFTCIADDAESPLPKEIDLRGAIDELKSRLKQGQLVHPPATSTSAGMFNGVHVIVTDPQDQKAPPQQQPKVRITLQIHTDLKEADAQTTQSMIGYALLAVSVSEFLEEMKAAEAAKVIPLAENP